MFKIFRYVLMPFSLVYGGIILARNKLFDKNILRSATFDFPLICVGNLATGGTGKTPMVEYLVKILLQKYKIATLSRGYKRKTKGYLVSDKQTQAIDIGDEPMQIHQKFPEITVAVAEERVMGIPQLLIEKPETEVIILDDAYQHREVNAGLNILLTDFNKLYTKDFLLPTGNLRDIKSSSKRADIIIVTKCKSNLNTKEKKSIIDELNPLSKQNVFFTKIEYESLYHLFTKEKFSLKNDMSLLVVCGIANPTPIKEFLKSKVSSFQILPYKDHYNFHSEDVKKIKDRFSKIENTNKIILTTEKDAVRLLKFEDELAQFPVYVLPMAHQFLFGAESTFQKIIFDFVNSFKH
ncbi:MAG: tetraacyldisaccharide 4'-kinase [Ginsengibacter sp.]